MAQVFGLECGLPKELRLVGSILEGSAGIGIVNMPRQVTVMSDKRERLDKQEEVIRDE